MSDTSLATPAPSATVILLRDTNDGIETLLLRRNSQLAFHGGAWVFPGGHIDEEDHVDGAADKMLAAAQNAAVREAKEEANLVIDPQKQIFFSHWTTPIVRPKRFSTWFFVAPAGQGTVEVDGGEIHDHSWMRPEQALGAQQAGEIELPPPTFVSITKLSVFQTVNDALTTLAGREPEIFFPRIQKVADGACCLYQGDAGYETENVDASGPRHRLWMIKSGWRYEQAQ
jgi:8-oxo-dGTP pyrophosphatase MutT (NUDIX family)